MALVRSSTNKEKDEPDTPPPPLPIAHQHEAGKRTTPVPTPTLKQTVKSMKASAVNKAEQFVHLFPDNMIKTSSQSSIKYFSLSNRTASFEDITNLSPVCDRTEPRMKRSNSDQELPPDDGHYQKHHFEERTSKSRMASRQPKLKKKTFSTLFSNQGSSIYLDCSKLNSRRNSQVCMDNKHNYEPRRSSIVTFGECYAQYNSESSLNAYYDQIPSVHHENSSGSTDMIITATQDYGEAKDTDEDLDYNHIKYVGMFALLYCWCFPVTGLLSLVYSKRAKRHYDQRDMAQAKKYLSLSQKLLIVTVLLGFLLLVIALAFIDYFYFKRRHWIA